MTDGNMRTQLQGVDIMNEDVCASEFQNIDMIDENWPLKTSGGPPKLQNIDMFYDNGLRTPEHR